MLISREIQIDPRASSRVLNSLIVPMGPICPCSLRWPLSWLQCAAYKIRPLAYVYITYSLFIQFWPWKGPIMCKGPLLILGGIPLPSDDILQRPRHGVSAWASGTYTWGLNFTCVYWNCDCILHRNCSGLKFILSVWLTFVLMRTIFHCSQVKNFCLVSFLAED